MSQSCQTLGAPRPRRRRRAGPPMHVNLEMPLPQLTTPVFSTATSRRRRRRRPTLQVQPRVFGGRGRGRGRGGLPRTPKAYSQPGLWWLLGQFQVGATTPAGPLELVVLHPANFPNTPYSAACMHHTHRVERQWDLKIEVTTATTTGARVAVFALPDPDWNPNTITPDMVWGSCLNGMGTLATVTGTGQTTSRFRLRTATNKLSNAHPNERNYLGYSAAVLVIYLLERPIAVTGQAVLTVSVLARVDLEVYNPIPGFLAFNSDQPPGPGPGPAPQPTAWSITIPKAKLTANMDNTWYNSHEASAWLAGGIYLKLPPTRPTGATDVKVTGDPKSFAVYSATVEAIGWHDNRGHIKTPKYFVTWREPASSVNQIVGFEEFENAANQARGETGLVPGGAESCLIYSGTPGKWSDYWAVPANVDVTISFVQQMLTSSSGSIYSGNIWYDCAAAGMDVALPLRSGEGLGPREVRRLPCSWGPMGLGATSWEGTPASWRPSTPSSLVSHPPSITSRMKLFPSATPPGKSVPNSPSPISCCSGSFHPGYGPRPPPSPPPLSVSDTYDRCDALVEEEIQGLLTRLASLTTNAADVGFGPSEVNHSGESFEVINPCPGCDNQDCEWCFEDDSDCGSSVDPV